MVYSGILLIKGVISNVCPNFYRWRRRRSDGNLLVSLTPSPHYTIARPLSAEGKTNYCCKRADILAKAVGSRESKMKRRDFLLGIETCPLFVRDYCSGLFVGLAPQKGVQCTLSHRADYH